METFPIDNIEGIIFLEQSKNIAWINNDAAGLLSLTEDTNDPTIIKQALYSLSKNSLNETKTEEYLVNIFNRTIKDEDSRLIIHFPQYFLTITYFSVSSGKEKGDLLLIKRTFRNAEVGQNNSLIQELSNLLVSVFNSTPSGIMAFRAIRDDGNEIYDFRCLIANENACKLLNKKEYELVGQRLKAVLPLNGELFEQYKLVTQTGTDLSIEQDYENNGKKFWLNINAVKLEDGFIIVITDITKRKTAEEKLKRSQAKLKAVLENTDDYIWSFNNDYVITTINSSFQEKVLHQTGELLHVGDKFDLTIFPKEAIPQWQGYFNRAFIGERFTEEVIIKVSDEEHILEYSFNPIKNKNEEIIGIAIFGRDITKRRKTESLIRQKSQMLNGLLNNLPIFIFRLDSEGKITESMGALKTLNLQKHQLIGNNVLELFPEAKDELLKVKKGKNAKFLSQRIIGGKTCFFEKFIFPDETNSEGAIGFAIDISNLKQIEAEIKKAKELAERANKSKNYFLANMSHDLRTPIHTILGFAKILLENGQSYESSKYLEYIISSGELLYKLVDDILELTKIEEGKLELKEVPFNFKKVLLSNLYPYQFQANEKGLDFKLHFDENLPPYCYGDAGKISRIIINLIGNSLKFTRKGYINVSFYCINSAEKTKTKKIKVVVEDTGIGVSKEKHHLIFNSFTQADSTINNTFGGSGLGLAIVKELVQIMQGAYGVESPINENTKIGGKGSAFWFIIPLEEVDPVLVKEHSEEIDEDINYQGNLKILLADDNIINRQLVNVILSNVGCKVIFAETGKEAIEILKKETFDLILMDVQMPVMNGIEATGYIRKKLGLKTPIIGLSANIYKEDIEKCMQAGMDDYLGKPFSKSTLLRRILKWATITPHKLSSKPTPLHNENHKIVDLTFLINLYNGDMTAVMQLIEEYFKYHNQLLEQMEEMLNISDFNNLASLAHNMRSSIRTIGLDCLHNSLISLEELAIQQKEHQKMKEIIDEIKLVSEQAENDIKNSNLNQ